MLKLLLLVLLLPSLVHSMDSEQNLSWYQEFSDYESCSSLSESELEDFEFEEILYELYNIGLHAAVSVNDAKSVERSLDLGTDVNLLNKDGNTALSLTPFNERCGDCSLDCARQLLAAGADLDVCCGPRGRTPLGIAVLLESTKHTKFFLEMGASIEKGGRKGLPLLFTPIRSGNAEILRLLLEAGADPNVCDENGSAPLHEAASCRSSLEIVRLLLDAGANVDRKDNHNRTALQIVLMSGIDNLFSQSNNGLECMITLVEAGANIFNSHSNDDVTAIELLEVMLFQVHSRQEQEPNEFVMITLHCFASLSYKRYKPTKKNYTRAHIRLREFFLCMVHYGIPLYVQIEIVNKSSLLSRDIALVMLYRLNEGGPVHYPMLTHSQERTVNYLLARFTKDAVSFIRSNPHTMTASHLSKIENMEKIYRPAISDVLKLKFLERVRKYATISLANDNEMCSMSLFSDCLESQ